MITWVDSCAMRKISGDAWHSDATTYYVAGHTTSETLAFLNETHFVSDRALRKFLRSEGISRGVAGAQKLKRFKCSCVKCKESFMGRTPTVLMCDACAGTDVVGVTKERLKQYQYFRVTSYGLDIASYEQMLENQAGLCGLCQKKMKQPCIDHDHSTGQVRGLLCHKCNLALGQIELTNSSMMWLDNARSWITKGVS